MVTYDGGNGNDSGNAIAIDSQGRILVAGYSSNGSDIDVLLQRYNTDGTLDTGFGTNGVVTYDGGNGGDHGDAITIDPNGNILVAGYKQQGTSKYSLLVLRYDTTGSLDTTFSSDGVVTYGGTPSCFGRSVITDIHGQVFVAGSRNGVVSNDILLLKYKSDGTPDTNFGTSGVVTYGGSGDDEAHSITIDSQGRILVGGYVHNSDYDMAVLRYTAAGSLDTTFGTTGIVIYNGGDMDYGYSITIDSQGRILVAGYSKNGSNNDMTVLRYTAAGSPDTTFGTSGVVTYNGSVDDKAYSITTDSQTRILVGGKTYNGNDYDVAVLRLIP